MENSLLSPGEKLRKLRKKYGFKQYELTGGEVSRNFISMVENGKANLTMRTAEVIARKANNILKNRNMNDIITAYELLESVESQIDKMAEDYLELLERDDIKETDIQEVIKFTFKQELTDSVFFLNVKIGDFYFKRRQFSAAILFYMSFFYYTPQNITGKRALESTLIKALKLFYLSGDFPKIIAAYNALIKNEKILSISSRRFMSQILIKTFSNIGDYKKALEFIDIKLANEVLLEDNSFKLGLIVKKGFCQYKLKNYSYALESFESVDRIRSFREIERQYKVIADIGIALIYLEINEKEKLNIILSQIEVELDKVEIDKKNYYYIYMNLANIYSRLRENDKFEKYISFYFNSINLNDFDEQLFNLHEVIKDFFEYYKVSLDENIFKDIKKLFINNASEIPLVQHNEIILELIKFCFENNLLDEAEELIRYKR